MFQEHKLVAKKWWQRSYEKIMLLLTSTNTDHIKEHVLCFKFIKIGRQKKKMETPLKPAQFKW